MSRLPTPDRYLKLGNKLELEFLPNGSFQIIHDRSDLGGYALHFPQWVAQNLLDHIAIAEVEYHGPPDEMPAINVKIRPIDRRKETP